MGNFPLAEKHLAAALASHETVDVGVVFRAGGVDSMANVELDLGRPPDALTRARHGLDLARRAADSKGEVDSRNTLGLATTHRLLGDLNAALRHASASDEAARSGQLHVRRTRVLVESAEIHLARGDLAEALRVGQEALDLSRRTGRRIGEAHALAGLGRAHRAAGDDLTSAACLREALAVFEELDAPEAAEVRASLERESRG